MNKTTHRWCSSVAGLIWILLWLTASGSVLAQEDGLTRVKRTGVLRWGCDSQGGAPYVYNDRENLGRLIGFEVELADALAAELGARAEAVPNQWSLLIPGLQRGDYDIAMNGLEVTPEREREVLFSKAYYISNLEVAVRKDEAPSRTLAGLRGKRVGTLKESLAERLLASMPEIQISAYEGQVEPYFDLGFKRLDAVVMDTPIARYYAHGRGFEMAPAEFGEARYAVACQKGDESLVAALDAAFEKLARTGKLREIYERYGIWNVGTARLLGDSDIHARASATMLEKFRHEGESGFFAAVQRYGGYLPLLRDGALMTLALSITGMAIAIALGLALALLRVYGAWPLRRLSIMYVEAIRGTPLLIQLYIIFYAFPQIGITLSPFAAAILGLGLNYTAYEAENYRAGLTSIAAGQSEAAHALGLTRLQTIRFVVIPQALRLVIPPVTNDFIALLKDSSIVSVIAMSELTRKYNEIASATGDRIGLGLLVGGLYFLIGFPFAKLAAYLESRARKGRR